MMYRRIMLACSLWLAWSVPSSVKYRRAVNWASIAVQPGGVRRRVGDFDVVRAGPGPDPSVLGGGQVRAEVVADDRDPGAGRVEGAQVAAELQEPGPRLARLDVPEQLVLAQLVSGEEVPHALGSGVGGTHPGPRPRPGSLPLPLMAAHCRPGRGWRFSGPNSSTQKITSGSPVFRDHLAVSDRVQVLHPRLLHRVVRVLRGLPGLYR